MINEPILRADKGRTILIAMLDENDKPIWTTRMVGTVEVDISTDDYSTVVDDMILSSWSAISETTVTVTGRPL